jgi:pyruvate formate lyase activating enzyme
MKSGGTVISSIEFSGKMSLVIFMAGCPLNCPYCHNSELISGGEELSILKVFKAIDESLDYIDAVVISGGEPLLQIEDLKSIFLYSKSLGLETKLDTSACYPKRLEKIIHLVDYLAMDVKAPFDSYKKISGSDIGYDVKKSMEIANKSENTFLECRTTYVPSLLSNNDIKQIANQISCDLYTLQQFRNKNVLDKDLENIENPNPLELKKLAKDIKPILKNIRIKTVEFGEEII